MRLTINILITLINLNYKLNNQLGGVYKPFFTYNLHIIYITTQLFSTAVDIFYSTSTEKLRFVNGVCFFIQQAAESSSSCKCAYKVTVCWAKSCISSLLPTFNPSVPSQHLFILLNRRLFLNQRNLLCINPIVTTRTHFTLLVSISSLRFLSSLSTFYHDFIQILFTNETNN